jgi:hypothetical protein
MTTYCLLSYHTSLLSETRTVPSDHKQRYLYLITHTHTHTLLETCLYKLHASPRLVFSTLRVSTTQITHV